MKLKLALLILTQVFMYSQNSLASIVEAQCVKVTKSKLEVLKERRALGAFSTRAGGEVLGSVSQSSCTGYYCNSQVQRDLEYFEELTKDKIAILRVFCRINHRAELDLRLRDEFSCQNVVDSVEPTIPGVYPSPAPVEPRRQ